MLEDQPYTKLILIILIISFACVGIVLYLPQIMNGTSGALSGDGTMLGIGLLGIIMICISPIFFIESFYSHEYVEAFLYGTLLLVIGFVFLITWLW
jgi:hypothetical protein